MVVLVFMLAIFGVAVIIGLLLYGLLASVGWLRWGHALLAGMVSGALPMWLAGFGLGLVLPIATVGGVIGLLVWWLWIFRNPAHPTVPTGMPWSMALLIPAACLWFWYLRQIGEQRVVGSVDSVAATGTGVDLRMQDGRTFSLVGRGLNPDGLPRGTCLVLMTRRSVTLLERRTYISHKIQGSACPQ